MAAILSLEEQLEVERQKNSQLLDVLEQERGRRIAAEESLSKFRRRQENYIQQQEAEGELLVNKVCL